MLHIVKSQYRRQIEEMTKNSRIQKWMFATPEQDIDDPTGEIRRLKKQVTEGGLPFFSALHLNGISRK